MNSIKRSVCLGCNLLCDDVGFAIKGREIIPETSCRQAHRWAENVNRHLELTASTGGKGSDQPLNHFSKVIAERLRQAQSPLVVGLNHLTTQAQQWAWRASDIAGAVIDVTLTNANRAGIYSLQRYGRVTATLGEIASRGDLVVFWFCDPMVTHPRLIERLTSTSAAKKKRIVVVESASADATATGAIADDVFRVEQHEAVDLIHSIRVNLERERASTQREQLETSGRSAASGDAKAASDSTTHDAVRLTQIMLQCQYGSWIHADAGRNGRWDEVALASQRLIRDLNDHLPFISLSLEPQQNSIGAENVLAAFSGFPAAINLGGAAPQYNGAEFSAQSILENGECDFVLWVAGWGTEAELKRLPLKAQAYLSSVAKVVVTSDAGIDLGTRDCFVVQRPGVDDRGEWCRLDDLSMGLSAMVGTADDRGVSAESLFKAVVDRLVDAEIQA